MASDIKLLPCPCCASEEVRLGKTERGCYGNYAFHYVMCTECWLQTTSRIDPKEVVELWNTRKAGGKG